MTSFTLFRLGCGFSFRSNEIFQMIHGMYQLIYNNIFICFVYYQENIEKMPRRKLCQHPIRHISSSYVATGSRWVSFRLLNFIRSRYYGLGQLNIRWLCPKYQKVEIKMMKERHEMVGNDDMDISDGELSENT
jgi:hypothetical protein